MAELGDTLGQHKTNTQDNTEQLGAVDTATFFTIPTENIVVRTVNIKVDQRSIAGSNLIWGNEVFGIWNEKLWSNTNESTFILGNVDNGILGLNQLGYGLSQNVRIWESKIWNDYLEDFTTTTYEGAATTASGWGSGSVVFSLLTSDVDFTTGTATADVVVAANQIYLQ